jgi:hypothetical protein
MFSRYVLSSAPVRLRGAPASGRALSWHKRVACLMESFLTGSRDILAIGTTFPNTPVSMPAQVHKRSWDLAFTILKIGR